MVELLERHPGLGQPTNEDRRMHPLTALPYAVICRSDEETLRILVVRHQSRDPDFGAGRR